MSSLEVSLIKSYPIASIAIFSGRFNGRAVACDSDFLGLDFGLTALLVFFFSVLFFFFPPLAGCQYSAGHKHPTRQAPESAVHARLASTGTWWGRTAAQAFCMLLSLD